MCKLIIIKEYFKLYRETYLCKDNIVIRSWQDVKWN